MRDGGVLNHIMKKCGFNGFGIEPQFARHNLGHSQRVNDIRFAALPALSGMGHIGERERVVDAVQTCGRVITAYGRFQLLILLLNGHEKSPPEYSMP